MPAFRRHTFVSFLLLGFSALTVAAQSPPGLHIPRVTRPPTLEDFLNGKEREAEAVVTDFRQREPGDGVSVSQPTTAYLSYDDRNLYVVFVCQDERAKIRARMVKREDIFSDDSVGVFLDTFRDRQRAYMFIANPFGIQLDGITTEGQDDDWSFDTLWHSQGRLTPDGYIVWLAVPFKSLRFPDASAQTWGLALGRFIQRTNENTFWPYITRRVEGFAQQLATLEGLERISPGRNLQFIPYGIFTRSRFLDPAAPGGPAFRTENDGRGGLDAKTVLRDALTLDLALNPDFSQVESDEPQVTVNQRFEVFFPEKRPFFIENAGFFQTPVNLFFSRRVADPQWGTRLTGKLGRWALGALAIDDRAPGRRLPISDPRRGRRSGIGVVRVQREFAAQSTLGLLVTSRDFADSSNRVFSLDTRLKLNPNWVLNGQLMRSYTRDLNGARAAGPAYWLELRRAGRNFVYSSNYSDRSPDFRTELGFVPRVDIRQTEHFAGYFWRPEGRRVVAFGPAVDALVNWHRAGRVQDWEASASFDVQWVADTFLNVSRGEAFELFSGTGFRKHSTAVVFSTAWLKWLTLSGRYTSGTNVNFFPATPLSPFLANTRRVNFGCTFRPWPQIRFDQTYIFTRLGTREGSTPGGFFPGTAIFNNHILRSKLNYQFTRELSLRAIFDYNAVLANTQLVSLERTKRFTADFLLTYLVHPGTAFYIGYTDIHENLTIDPTMPPTLRRTRSPDTPIGRQFFAKLSYLLRF